MLKQLKKTNKLLAIYVVMVLVMGLFSLYFAYAVPQGAQLSGAASVDSGPTKTPYSRSDDGGQIITMNLNLEQQNEGWKAYVGNVSGNLVLQNTNNISIYEWPLASVGGEVYISRNDSVDFTAGSVTCASAAEMASENTFFEFASSAIDNINNTFNSTTHTGFSAGANALANCPSTALWVNETEQDQDANAKFQVIALHDTTTMVFAGLINNDENGFDNQTYDFQIIVPENASATTGTAYYFYVELDT